MTEQRINTIVWVFLVFIIAISYFLAESRFSFAKFFILGISFVKFNFVGYFFMGTRHSHVIWRLLILVFISIFTVLSFI